ncbi:MAG: acylphosphatase [Elusimicrobia bacterium]|nr:acylphosphatase [Elusimicrobiota bacterium]
MENKKIIVRGYVQGVGFRWFVRRVATSLGIDGTVRNLPNGDVEIMARGTEKQINEMIKTLYSGPGRVEGVSAENSREIKTEGFHIIF